MYIFIHKFIFFVFCYYAKYGRVRGSRGSPQKLPDESVLERHKQNFLVIVSGFVVNIIIISAKNLVCFFD